MDARIKTLIEQGDKMFAKREQGLMRHWQDIGEQFCPQYASFTREMQWGDDYVSNLTTSYPLMVAREFSGAISAMTRPRDILWGSIGVDKEDQLDRAGREYLEWASAVQRTAMYDRSAQFTRATKEADDGYAAFGQWPISVEWDWKANSLLYRSWHLRDVVWCEGYNGKIARIDRNWKPTAKVLCDMFPKTVDAKVRKCLEKEPYREIAVRRIMIRAEDYESPAGGKRWKHDWVSIYVDIENKTLLEEAGSKTSKHVIPRWKTCPGSPYAYSPATTIALPDARLLQAMSLTLLEAGEMAVRPPLLMVGEAVRSDFNYHAGGVTRVAAEYDERLGEVLRPVTQDKNGLPFGLEMSQNIKDMLGQAFYLNKLTLPPVTHEMTAFETAQRIQEYIRAALPLFEPLEDEYNGGLMEETFETLKGLTPDGGMFRGKRVPESISRANVRWKFRSPLHDAIERKLSGAFVETQTLIMNAMELDPTLGNEVDLHVAFRDALVGIGAPAKWRRDEAVADQMTQDQRDQQTQAQQMAQIQQGGEAGLAVGQAGQAIQQAEAGVAA